MPRLLIEKFSDETDVAVDVLETGRLRLVLGADECELTRANASRLRDRLADALTETREFCRTTGTRRADGSYVVSRRTARSDGHRKVFDSFEGCVRLFDRLPAEFTAADVGETGLTGGRRHTVLWHFVEHPTFRCELVTKQPLTARKVDLSAETNAGEPAETT